MSDPTLPFAGIRVLDLTRVMSGPFCTAMLADLGAEIIKVELPGIGDEGRFFAPHIAGESAYFAMLNRGKESIAVDMKSVQGRDLVGRLAERADVLVENFRPGVMDRLGLGHEALRARNGRLIYASISGFGDESPFRDWPAFDLVIQAMSGLMSVTGEREGRPLPVGESVADVATGMFAAWGIAAALFDRERTGSGRRVDVAMLDSVFSMMITGLSRRLYTDRPSGRVGARHPETYPVDSFVAADGPFVLVAFSDTAFRGLCSAMGRPELGDDPRFRTNADRNQNETALRDLIAEWAIGQGRDAAVAQLQAAGVPAAPVWSFDDLLASGHVESRGLLVEGVNTRLGAIHLAPQPVRFAGTMRVSSQRSPLLGEHTEAVLRRELGLEDADLAALRAAKAI